MNRKQRSNNAQQPQPWRTTIGNDEAAEKRYKKEEQGEDYNQPRQEHANDGIAVGEHGVRWNTSHGGACS